MDFWRVRTEGRTDGQRYHKRFSRTKKYKTCIFSPFWLKIQQRTQKTFGGGLVLRAEPNLRQGQELQYFVVAFCEIQNFVNAFCEIQYFVSAFCEIQYFVGAFCEIQR